MAVNSRMQAVLDQYARFKAPRLEALTPENARRLPTLKNAVEEMTIDSLATRMLTVAKPIPQSVGRIDHILIPGPNGDILARVFHPKGDGPFPLIVYFHGGGWVIGNLDSCEPSCRSLCHTAKSVVVSVAYRQAPEYRFPAAVEDAHAALQWAMINATTLLGDPARVVVCGEDSGGNLATVACLKARDEGGHLPFAQLLIYPITDSRMNTPSYREFAHARPLSSKIMPWFWQHYVHDVAESHEAYASPLRAPNLNSLPPAIIITAEIDPVRDEAEAYGRRLIDSGNQVSAKRYLGVTHDFFGLVGVVDEAKRAVTDAAAELQRIFTQQPAFAAATP